MKVSELYESSPVRGNEVYIVGTGPTLRVFPVEYLRDKTCILLNNAHRILPGFGPVAFSNHRAFLEKDNCRCPVQIVKGRHKYGENPTRTDNHVSWNDPKYHVFSYREPPWDKRSHFEDASLWAEPDFYWNTPRGTVAIFACQFALLAGATAIHLVGCDCCEFTGLDPHPEKPKDDMTLKCASRKARGPKSMAHDYDSYARGLDRLVREARERFNVPILHCSPFPGFGREQQQFRAMQDWADAGWW